MIKKGKPFNKKDLFYYGLLALPLLQFSIFYIYVNFNSFILAVKSFNVETLEYDFVGLKNFQAVFE